MNLVKATGTIGGLTLVSRVAGFLREMLMSRIMGASAAADAFFVAFRLPNTFRRLFGEGAFSAGFVPLFSQRLHGEGGRHRRVHPAAHRDQHLVGHGVTAWRTGAPAAAAAGPSAGARTARAWVTATTNLIPLFSTLKRTKMALHFFNKCFIYISGNGNNYFFRCIHIMYILP